MTVSLAARAEQEIRAYPRLHAWFYAVVGRNDRFRHLAGQVLNEVRSSGEPVDLASLGEDEPEVRLRRETAIAVRLGLRGRAAP